MENVLEAMNEFQDWEMLPSDSDDNSPALDAFDDIRCAGPLLQPDYFSLDAQNRSFLDDSKSVGSDNPSWIEPGSDDNPIRSLNQESSEYWSDPGSDLHEVTKTSDSVREFESSLSESTKDEVGLVGIGEMVDGLKDNSVDSDPAEFCSDTDRIEESPGKVDPCVENSDLGIESSTGLRHQVEALEEEKLQEEPIRSADGHGSNDCDKIVKRGIVWWKMPIELLKFCAFRMSPVWAVTVAAAVMGFVILGRRLCKMKTKTKGLQIKVALDDKKVSQVMSRAARLNEAFSVVKRVPVIRTSLPAVGVTSFPAMSLR